MKKKKSLVLTILIATWLMVSVLTLRTKAADSSLVGYWKFDEGSGTTAIDSSGNGNSGTLNNGPTWVNGKFGEALIFDGVNDYVQISQSSSLDVTSQVTVEAWVYPNAYVDSTGMTSAIISRTPLNGGHIYMLSIYPDSHKASYSVNPIPWEHSSDADLPLNTWTYLAMTYDGAYVRLYMNGALDSSYPLSEPIQTTSNWLAFGCIPCGPQGGVGTYAYFNGMIDDVRIYNRALSQLEIQTDMTGPQAATLSLTPNSGIAATTVIGTGFSPNSRISITWDGTQIPTVPSPLITDASGNFTAMISVPTQTTPSTHTSKATDILGNEASATFTVINMTGSRGEAGEPSIIINAFTIGASILAICLAVIALLKKRT